MEVFTCF